jgi:hypothetical protein
MKNSMAILMLMVVAGCSQSQVNSVEVSADNIGVKLNVDSNSIIFKRDFDVVITIENNTSKTIEIDTSPDEVIQPPSETSGGQYRPRGSNCTITVTQDYD